MAHHLKQQIAGSFSRHSSSYDQYARLQKTSADFLLERVRKIRTALPAGSVLEVGCGSGLLSAILVDIFVDREIFLMDIAPGMLRECRSRLQENSSSPTNVHFLEMDAETITGREQHALIVSGLTVQWFNRLRESMIRFYEALAPGGVLIVSFLAAGSFPEWAAQCEKSGVPCTLNPLPDSRIMADIFQGRAAGMEHWQREVRLTYPSAREFFVSLKKTGAGINVLGKTLTVGQLKRLFSQWQRQCPATVQLTCTVQYWQICKGTSHDPS